VHSKKLGVKIFCTPKKMKILECAKDALQFFGKKLESTPSFYLAYSKKWVGQNGCNS
jgi:hypothetical protein